MSTMQERTMESDQDKARRCLEYVDPNRRRPDWIRVLNVCKELGLSESEVFAWSSGAEAERRAGQREFATQWRNCGKRSGSGGVTLGTLITFARQDGMPHEAVQRRYEVGLPQGSDHYTQPPKEFEGKIQVATYRYAERLMTVRYEGPGLNHPDFEKLFGHVKDRKKVCPFYWRENYGWVMGRGGDDLWPPYRQGPDDAELVDVVEGEKCVDALCRLYEPDAGRAVMTSQGGSSSAHKTDWSCLVGKRVCIWPDNDDDGAKYAKAVAELAVNAGARSVRIVQPFEDFGPGGDVADYLDNAANDLHLEKNEQREALEARRLEADDLIQGPPTASNLDALLERLKAMHGSGWMGLRLKGWPKVDDALCGLRGLTIVAGAPGTGKTQLTLQWSLDVLESNPDACAIYVSLEMTPDDLDIRMLGMMSRMPWRRIALGDEGEPLNDQGYRLNASAMRKLHDAANHLRSFGHRRTIVDKWPMDANPDRAGAARDAWIEHMRNVIEDAKKWSGMSRALVIVDNLQAIPAPDTGDLFARDVRCIEGVRALTNQLGSDDAVVVVSEVAKKAFTTGSGQGDVLGTGRNAYRADAVFGLNHRKFIKAPDADPDDPESKDKVVPKNPAEMNLTLWKGRAGMKRGVIPIRWDHDFAWFEEGT